MIPLAMSLLGQFCQWLEQTPPSQYIQTASWVVPTVQTIHILAIAAVVGSALMINLRLLGALERDQSVASVTNRFAPVIWWALPLLLVTGAIMTLGEPSRELLNPVFRLKMLLLAAAMALLATFQSRLRRDPVRYELAGDSRKPAMLIALPSLALWAGIVLAGRWIAYI